MGPHWGCTMIPLVGDTAHHMKPRVSLTSGRVPILVQPQVMPEVRICMYVCTRAGTLEAGSHACHGVKWACAGRTSSASDPQSTGRSYPCSASMQSHTYVDHMRIRNMSAVYHPSPPGDGEAPPGDTAGEDATHPSRTGPVSAARTSPHPPLSAGYRSGYNSPPSGAQVQPGEV